MICRDVEQHLDRFLDRELPTPMLLAVARHAGECAGCDHMLREFAALGDALQQTVAADVDALDLSGIWPAVEARVHGAKTRRSWVRRMRTVPMWASALAAAATLVFWLQTTPGERERAVVAQRDPAPRAERVAMRTPPNEARIDRLAGKGVALRREPKAGTTLIWVNYTNPGGAW
ncbi:MAG: zf-HC2 domain-containing protein [Candidatus Binatia bacterium]